MKVTANKKNGKSIWRKEKILFIGCKIKYIMMRCDWFSFSQRILQNVQSPKNVEIPTSADSIAEATSFGQLSHMNGMNMRGWTKNPLRINLRYFMPHASGLCSIRKFIWIKNSFDDCATSVACKGNCMRQFGMGDFIRHMQVKKHEFFGLLLILKTLWWIYRLFCISMRNILCCVR